GPIEASVIDSIVWGETEAEFIYKDEQSKVNITYSTVEGAYYGKGNKKDDPIFTSGPNGSYYLSHTGAGQSANSPCIDIGSDTAENLELNELTTRIDNVTDSGQVDMGFHYLLAAATDQVKFALTTDPNQSTFANGDSFNILLDVTTYSTPVTCDIYIVLFNMGSGGAYFGLSWGGAPKAALKDLLLPSGISLKGVTLLPITIPSLNPPIADNGTYTLAIAAAKPGTLEFLSNIATASFTVVFED
ncbi:MAG: hypothetical protein GY853_13700, partial [PVC group bacterium]|nr:hypothetical protein [PVC group bacterium]